jgi:soluble lytic murein transglycosylase
MRTASLSIVLLFLCAGLQAEVRLTIKRDGTKVISNFGANASPKSNDWNWWAKQRDRRSSYDAFIDRYAAQYRVDPVLVRAVIQVESNFNPRCVSNKGARGLMQLMPETEREYRVRNVFSSATAVTSIAHWPPTTPAAAPLQSIAASRRMKRR